MVLKAKGWLDAPNDGDEISNTYLLYGWYLSENEVLKVEILLDNNIIGEAYYGDFREHFDTLFPEYKNVNAGFNFSCNTKSIKNGEHTLDIRILENNGEINFLKQVKIKVNNSHNKIELTQNRSHSESRCKDIIENREINEDLDYSYDWYRKQIITKELFGSKINFGRTIYIASGTGKRAILFHEKTKKPIVGLDNDEFAIEYSNRCAKEYFGDEIYNIKFIQSSFYELPFEDNSFDSGIFIEGVEHALYPQRILEEIRRVIKPNGYLFLTITKENYHADPTHLSLWSSKSIKRFMSNYGDCKIKLIDNTFFVTLKFAEFIFTNKKPIVTYCDLNIRDTYTPNWVEAFKMNCDLRMLSLKETNLQAKELIINDILDKCDGADLLHLGTGANFSNIQELLEKVKYQYPELLISKWYGDVDESRYISEVYEPSNYFDMSFVASGHFIGKIKSPCGQVHMNGVYDQKLCEFIEWDKKDIDVLIIANAYSEERLANIKSFLPQNERVSVLWIGDGSPFGRVSRQDAFKFYKRSKIVYNIVDNKNAQSTFCVSTRVYLAIACGCLVFTTRLPYVDNLFDGGIIQLPNDKEIWQVSAYEWLNRIDNSKIKEIINKNYEQISKYHSFDYKVKSILFHNGLRKGL
ncbi:methyltransferase domain-containing protein [Desulfosporosinus sp. SB140]|uniref:methyltransferase domain-containing protein n=1 Tax=Desulfosporosinus paludis TaxID=3115649 RepID=UPI00388DECCE